MDTEAFERDGYVVVRGAFGEDTTRACRDMIWDVLAGRGVSPDGRTTWAAPADQVQLPPRASRSLRQAPPQAARRL